MKRNQWQVFVFFLSAFLIAALIATVSYYFDNKYTTSAPRGQDGAITIFSTDLQDGQLIPLIDGWACWPGQLVCPQNTENAPVHVFAGQNADFSNIIGTAYGQVTYGLTIRQSGEPLALRLELQELFSSSRVYVNGNLVLENGVPDVTSYHPHIQNQTLDLPAVPVIELVIQTANYSHYYSGLFYPPMLGTPQSIGNMLAIRMSFYGLLCFFTLGIAASSLAFWLFSSGKPCAELLLGGIAVLFSIHTAYPFLHQIGGVQTALIYVLEDASFFLILLHIVLLTQLLIKPKNRRLTHTMVGITLFLCFAALIFPVVLLPRYPSLHTLYGLIVDLGKLVVAVYLLAYSIQNVRSNKYTALLLCGNGIYAFSMLFDVFNAGMIEPIRFGWPNEFSGFLFILLFAAQMVIQGIRVQRENHLLTEHLEEVVSQRTAQLRTLENERKRFFAGLTHDLKAPVSALSMYIDLIRSANVEVDEELNEYLSIIEQKNKEAHQRVLDMQALSSSEGQLGQIEPIELSAFLREVHHTYQPDTDAVGIYFVLELYSDKAYFLGDRKLFLRVMENIIFNSLDFTSEGGTIALRANIQQNQAVISIADTGSGISPDLLPRIFDYGITTRTEGTRGFGLSFAKNTIVASGGTIHAASKENQGTNIEITLPLLSGRAAQSHANFGGIT